MKRFLSLLLAAVLCLTAAAALAESATLVNTSAMLQAFEAEGWKYTLKGMSADGNFEQVFIGFQTDNIPGGLNLQILVRSELSYVRMYCWNLIEYDAEDYEQVALLCDQLTNEFSFVSFCCDETTHTVTAKFAAYLTEDSAGEIAVNMVNTMKNIVDEAYPTLSPYSK